MELLWQEVLRDIFAISSLAVLAESGGVVAQIAITGKTGL